MGSLTLARWIGVGSIQITERSFTMGARIIDEAMEQAKHQTEPETISAIQQSPQMDEEEARSFLSDFANYISDPSGLRQDARDYEMRTGKSATSKIGGFFNKALKTISGILGTAIEIVGNVAKTLLNVIFSILNGAVNLILNVARGLCGMLKLETLED